MSEQDVIKSGYSKLTLHRKCPQAFYYKHILKLEEPEDAIAPKRDFGSWWAAVRAAEALERGRQKESLLHTPRVFTGFPGYELDMKTVTVEEVFEAVEHWWKGHQHQQTPEGETAYDQWQSELGGEAPTLLRNLLTRHLERWADEIKHEAPLGVEVQWERTLPNPKDEWVPEGYPEMVLTGHVDEIYRDERRGIIVVRDGKTTGKLDAGSALDDMMDSQLQLYAWGADPLVREWTGGKGIGAVAYDRAKSIAPKPPSLTKSGRLRQYKGEPTVGMTDLKTYLEWVAEGPEFEGTKKDGSGAGVYEAEDAVIEKLSTSASKSMWFQRTQVPLNRSLIRTHLRAAVDSSFDQHRTAVRTARTMEAQRNLTNACKFCPFVKLCRAQMIGGPEGTYDLPQFELRGQNGEKTLEEGALV